MKLKKINRVYIEPKAPFDFDSTFHKPDHFTSGDNSWEPGVRWQTWFWQGKQLGIKFINLGTKAKPKVAVDIYYGSKLESAFVKSLINEIRYSYNLDLNLGPFYSTFKNDKVLGPVIKRWRGMRPGHPSSLYEYIIIGFVLQNASVRRSAQMFKALLEKYGKFLEFDGKKLWCFWEPGDIYKKKVTEAQLKILKVGYRAKFIRTVDKQFANGEIDEFYLRNRGREEQMNALVDIYGVGPATVWYILFDVFHHLDYFEHVSPWEQKIYSKLFFNKDPENPVPVKRILKYLERYGDYKHLAVHYLWEDLWWKRTHEHIPWLEKQIRL